jgi:hypothetical protein
VTSSPFEKENTIIHISGSTTEMNKGRMKKKGQARVVGYDVDRHERFGSGNIFAGHHGLRQ